MPKYTGDPIAQMAATIDSPAEQRRLKQERERVAREAEREATDKAWTNETWGQYADHCSHLQRTQDKKGRPHCAQCTFFSFDVELTKRKGEYVGTCHAVSPTAVYDSGEHGRGPVNGFPLVRSTDWCPEWDDGPIKFKVST